MARMRKQIMREGVPGMPGFEPPAPDEDDGDEEEEEEQETGPVTTYVLSPRSGGPSERLLAFRHQMQAAFARK